MDETLAHQTADTFDHVFTSDRNFYDRHYFNLHPKGGEFFLIIGMGQYPNLGTTDAFVCVSIDDTQYVVRASRELDGDRIDTKVGPFGVEIVESLKQMRVWCDDNEHDVSFDLVFKGSSPVVEEPRTVIRRHRAIEMDVSRYTQAGTWSGKLNVAGKIINILHDDHLGVRDHSWGIRPIGETVAPGIKSKDFTDGYGFFHTWIPMQFENYLLKLFVEENMKGERLVEESVRVNNFKHGGAIEQMGRPEHKFTFKSGTRELSAAVLEFSDPEGNQMKVKATPLRTVYLAGGTGYIAKTDWAHGMYQGPLKVEGLRFDVGDPAVRAELGPLYETLCKFELNSGEVTYGMLENLIVGMCSSYGFDTWDAVAP
tara:strand:- start:883 stop:1989 length:1107 start_codon:yes stop_codon:yes gene_type:complete